MGEKLEESGGGAAIEMTGRIMLLAIILFSLLISVLVFLHLYRRRRLRHHDGTNINITTIGGGGGIGSRGRLNTTSQARGLDPSTIPPVIVFSPKQFKDGLECSVCLSEVSLGEETRVLPKCNHAFHAQCIDMWFHSHSTCPICRTPVFISNPQTHPTNLLYWGSNHVVDTTTTTTTESTTVTSSSPTTTTTAATTTITSSSSSPVVNDHLNDLVIEIPRQNNLLEEDDKSPVVVDSRLSAALKTLFSRADQTN